MADNEDTKAQAAKGVYLTKFAQTLHDRGYGCIVEDEDRLAKAVQTAQAMDKQAQKVAAKIQPVIASLVDETLDELLAGDDD